MLLIKLSLFYLRNFFLMKQVVIASQNPVKVNTIKNCFAKVFPEQEFEYISVNVASDVPDQPLGDDQTLLWAQNRVKNARKLYPDAEFVSAGLEWWVTIDEDWIGWSYARIYVESHDKVGMAKTAMLQLPPRVVELLKTGIELGDADDIVFWQTNSKQKMWAVWLLTDWLIDRIMFYEHACILALIPFLKTELY